jgi:Fic family protein
MNYAVSEFEPLHLPEGDTDLEDLVFDLVQRSASLASHLPRAVKEELGRLVRSMNCYYSNFIEGHQTHPRDIERALANDFSADLKQRNLQLEARAHIDLQVMIDLRQDPSDWPTASSYVRWLHYEFCHRLPKEMLWVSNSDNTRQLAVIPGAYRDDDVAVGMHHPPAAAQIPEFMTRFERAYDAARLSKTAIVISAAAAHHRLLWVHPFLDGNGRVARLMSHSMLHRIGIGSSLWSIARGLARRVDEYKAALTHADAARRNDLDGRGALSLEGLKHFCRFFLTTCIDQIEFMRNLLEPTEIIRRIENYVRDEISAKRLPRGSFELLREAYYQGEIPRGRAPEITRYEERRARETLSVLLEKGLLTSKGPRAPVSLAFPPDVLERWLPTLYPMDAPRT